MLMSSWAFVSSLLVWSPASSEDTSPHLELFWNLYSAVVRGSRILHDVTEGVGAVSKAIKAIDSFLEMPLDDPTATTDKEPNQDTPKGEEAPEKGTFKPDEELPVFSGCGALGFHIRDENLPVARMTECCVSHDDCYTSSCKSNKKDCDSKLGSCLFNICDTTPFAEKTRMKTCKSAAKLLFSGTMALSFKQFNDAQTNLNCKGKSGKWKK